jgi:hypothetical protein
MSSVLEEGHDAAGSTERTGQLIAGQWWLAVPVMVYALLVLPFVFHDVVGEPDLERMAMAMMYGASSGLDAAAGFHYGMEVSFGYYFGFYHLLPREVLLDSSSLIATINFVGYASAVLGISMLALYAARLYGVITAVVTCILFAFSPVFLDLGTSGHPQVPAFALTLMGAWLLTYATDATVRGGYRVVLGVLAFAALTIALTMQCNVLLAFPFIALAARGGELRSREEWLLAAGYRASVMFTACVAFWILRSYAFNDDSGYVANFFVTFYKPDAVSRSVLVLVLCTGVATIIALVGLLLWLASRALQGVSAVGLVLLALPSLAFWLPNSPLGRHLIWVTLAVAFLLALMVQAARPRMAIGAAVLLVISNQAIAEISHGWLEQNYQWTFPALSARRATQAVPMGLFPLDHEAKQQAFIMLRNEGQSFARTCSGNVLAFAEEPHYMMLSMIERDRSVRLKVVEVGDTKVVQARGVRCSVDFVEKQAASHRDALKEFLQAGYDIGWPIYFQESRRSTSDRTPVPEERRYCVRKTADGWCDSASAY